MPFQSVSLDYENPQYGYFDCTCAQNCDASLFYLKSRVKPTSVSRLLLNPTYETFNIFKEIRYIFGQNEKNMMLCPTPYVMSSISHNYEKIIFLSNAFHSVNEPNYRNHKYPCRNLLDDLAKVTYSLLMERMYFILYTLSKILTKDDPTKDVNILLSRKYDNCFITMSVDNLETRPILIFLRPHNFGNPKNHLFPVPSLFLRELVVTTLQNFTPTVIKKVSIKYGKYEKIGIINSLLHNIAARYDKKQLIVEHYFNNGEADVLSLYAKNFLAPFDSGLIGESMIITLPYLNFINFYNGENHNLYLQSTVELLAKIGFDHPLNNDCAYISIPYNLLEKELIEHPEKFEINYPISFLVYRLHNMPDVTDEDFYNLIKYVDDAPFEYIIYNFLVNELRSIYLRREVAVKLTFVILFICVFKYLNNLLDSWFLKNYFDHPKI